MSNPVIKAAARILRHRRHSVAQFMDEAFKALDDGEPQTALHIFTGLLGNHRLSAEETARILAGRGEALIELGRDEDALRDLDRAVRVDPALPEGWFFRGMARDYLGDLRGAVEDWTESLRLAPEYAAAASLRAGAWRALGRPDLALADYDHALALNPEDAENLLNRGYARLHLAEYNGARNDFLAALRAEPEYVPALVGLGHVRADRGEHESAVRHFEQALHLDPDNVPALAGRGHSLAESGFLQQAMSDFARALELAPEDGYTHYLRGLCLLREDEAERALPDLDRAVDLEPDNPDFLSHRAEARDLLGDYAGALEDYENAARVGGDEQARWLNHAAWLLATCPDYEVRDGERAVALAERAVSLSGHPQGWETLAAALAQAGRYAEAAEAQQTLLEHIRSGLADPSELPDEAEAERALRAYREHGRFPSGDAPLQ